MQHPITTQADKKVRHDDDVAPLEKGASQSGAIAPLRSYSSAGLLYRPHVQKDSFQNMATGRSTESGKTDPEADPIEQQIKSHTGSKHVIVVAGNSALGIKNPEIVRHEFLSVALELTQKCGGASNLILVIGATKFGIGFLYGLAKQLGIATLGIVSSKVQENPSDLSPDCDHVIIVDDPHETWEVKSPSGHSYMVTAALLGGRGGSFYAFGGGAVAVKEAIEAAERGVPTRIYPGIRPDPAAVFERLNNKGSFNSMPMRDLARKLQKAGSNALPIEIAKARQPPP